MKQTENINISHIERIFNLMLEYTRNNINLEELDKELARDSTGINSQLAQKDTTLYLYGLDNGTILHLLTVFDSHKVLPILEKYIDYSLFDTRDARGETPIMLATCYSQLDTAKALIESQKRFLKNLDYNEKTINQELTKTINIANNEGKTSLHCVAQFYKVEKFRFLLLLGADIAVKDKIGKTPLEYAVDLEISDNFTANDKTESIIKLVGAIEKFRKENNSYKSFAEITQQTQRVGNTFQEQELLRASNKATGITSYCTIS